MPGKHSTMKMSHAKMKTPMKKNIKNPSDKQKAAFDVNKDGTVTGAEMTSVFDMKTPMQMKEPMKMSHAKMKEPMKMKSPAKMGTAYKLDKSAFKMKNGPMKMYGDKAGSMAKMAGVMKMKTPMDMKSPMKNTDVTEEYKKKGNEATRKHIAEGGKVIKDKNGQLKLTK